MIVISNKLFSESITFPICGAHYLEINLSDLSFNTFNQNIYFIDTNKNGTIDKKDFDMALERVAKIRKLNSDDPKHKEVAGNLSYVWEHLKQVADRDNDGTVSEQEWLKMWEEANSLQQQPAWVQRYQSFLFEVEDVSGDGKIDETEYIQAYTHFGLTADECKNAFKKLTTVKDDFWNNQNSAKNIGWYRVLTNERSEQWPLINFQSGEKEINKQLFEQRFNEFIT